MAEYKPETPRSKRLIDSQSKRAAECPKCHEVFSSVNMFDKHLKRVSDKYDTYRMTCTDPVTHDMSLNASGYWTIPQENKWWET